MKPKLPIEKLSAKWKEILDSNFEVVRVLTIGEQVVYRVAPHGKRRWRVEAKVRVGSTFAWQSFTMARGKYKTRSVRTWGSPEAAMRAAEDDCEVKVSQ